MAQPKKPHTMRRRREAIGFSQRELARKLGVKEMTVSRWERGVSVPQRRLWPKITKCLGLTPAEFFQVEAA